MIAEKLTDEERAAYVEGGGQCCPRCESMAFEGQGVTFEAGHVLQEVVCADCGAHWYDVYTLTACENPED